MVTRFKVERDSPLGRNAPGPHAALSGCVDALQHSADEARAAGLHSIAAELDTHRDAVVTLARRLWGARAMRDE